MNGLGLLKHFYGLGYVHSACMSNFLVFIYRYTLVRVFKYGISLSCMHAI